MLFFSPVLFTFYSSKNPRKKFITSSKKYQAAQLSPILIMYRYQMISEGSCDTEDENSALHHRNKLYYRQIEQHYFKL